MEQIAYYTFGNPRSELYFLQLVDAHDLSLMEREASALEEQTGAADWCIVAVPVADWNQELTPWTADPVFGNRGFGDGAPKTLERLIEQIIPAMERTYPAKHRTYILCGYSLAGLSSLWAAYQTDVFAGVVAASPSVWYPGWLRYAKEHPIHANSVYLSLGDREERTKNPVMATVGENIRELYQLFTEKGISCQLDWNPGNHFMDSDLRMAKGMAWMVKMMKD